MPVKVRKTFWKVHPFSDAILREKKKNHRQAERAQTLSPNLLPEDQPAAFPLWSARDAPSHHPWDWALAEGSSVLPEQPQPHWGVGNTSQCCSSYTYTVRGKEAQARYQSRNSGEEKLGKLEIWGVFAGFFFEPQEKALRKDLTIPQFTTQPSSSELYVCK